MHPWPERILRSKSSDSAFWSVEPTDFKNVIFENIHWALFEVAEVAEVAEVKNLETQNDQNSKSKLPYLVKKWFAITSRPSFKLAKTMKPFNTFQQKLARNIFLTEVPI